MGCPSLVSRCIVVPAAALLLAALAPPGARAEEFVRHFESPRGVSMGDALTALADSFDAMLYNPAGISQSQAGRVEARYWEEESRDDGVLAGKDFFDALDGLGGQSPLVAEAFLGTTATRPQSLRTQALAGFHTGGGLGLAWVDSTRQFTRAAESVPEASLQVGYDRLSGGLLTLGWASDLRLLMWGVTLKYLKREAAVRNVPPDVLAQQVFDPAFAVEGDSEFDYDVGLLARLPFPFLRPTLAVAMLNVRSPDFGLADVPPMERELNVGLALRPDLLPDVARLTVSFETRDVNKQALADEADRRREGWGVELALFPQQDEVHLLTVRAGNNQQQASFGVAASLWGFASLELVQYNEELGQGTHSDPQRRRMIRLTLGF